MRMEARQTLPSVGWLPGCERPLGAALTPEGMVDPRLLGEERPAPLVALGQRCREQPAASSERQWQPLFVPRSDRVISTDSVPRPSPQQATPFAVLGC